MDGVEEGGWGEFYRNGKGKLFIFVVLLRAAPARGVRVGVKEEACDEAKKQYGYFVLLSNDMKDPVRALHIYRTKDVVEKAFGNIKERLNGRRMHVSSDAALEGKLFVQFVALIYLSYIRKHMIDKKLFGKYTLAGLIDELDMIECFRREGKSPYLGEMVEKQKQIFIDMEVPVPTKVSSL